MTDSSWCEAKARERVVGAGRLRWTSPWLGYTLAVLVGATVHAGGEMRASDLVVGLVPSWLVGWAQQRWGTAAAIVGYTLLVAAGVTVGVLNPH